MFIYKITNTTNGKIYIGLDGSKPHQNRRWSAHTFHARHPEKPTRKILYKAMHKYGLDAFTHEVIETVESYELLKQRETYWIDFYQSLTPTGYNMTTGGEGSLLREDLDPAVREYLKERFSQGAKTMNAVKWAPENYDKNKQEFLAYSRTPSAIQAKKAAIQRDWDSCSPKQKEYRRRGLLAATEKRRPKYVVTSPEGEIFNVDHIQTFCSDHGLSVGSMQENARLFKKTQRERKFQGWACRFKV